MFKLALNVRRLCWALRQLALKPGATNWKGGLEGPANRFDIR